MEENAMKEQTNIILCLLNKITDGGKITEENVNDLRKCLLNEDGTYNINLEIANRLFELLYMAKNEQVVNSGYNDLFKDSICTYLLKDKFSTGFLDDKEVEWLINKIENGNSEIDDTIFNLIQELKAKSFNHFPENLDSTIIHRRLRGIQKLLSESKSVDKDMFNEIIERLDKCVKERDKLFIDDKCILALFSIKDQLSRRKLLHLPDEWNKQVEQENTDESLADRFNRVFCELVSANILYDTNSPYDVDETEANKLKKIINHKTSVDYIDKALLDELESRSMYFPEVLAKVGFGYETASVRTKVVNALLEELGTEKAKDALGELDKYINKSHECTNEQKLKAELLFDLKNLTKREDFNEGEEEEDFEHDIQKKYVDQVTKYITGEESQSPNEIDEKEEEWLEERLSVSESRYYECDEELLIRLKRCSVNFPKSLEERLSRAIMKRIFLKLKGSKEVVGTDLKELKDAIFDDNDEFKIDPKEAAEFIFKIKDCICEKERVSFVQLLNRLISGIKKCFFKVWKYFFPSDKDDEKDPFENFFVEVVSSYLLKDKNSFGKIDEAETEWLLAKININGKTDKYDKALLDSLEKTSINHPDVLHYICGLKDRFRGFLHWARKMCVIAIVSCLVASLFLFIKGAVHVGEGLIVQWENFQWENFTSEKAFIKIIEGIDSFLVAMVVFILGIGIYELFIRKLEKPYKVNEKRPSWMQMNTIDDLKSSLVKVLIIAMMVGFYKMTLSSPLDIISLLAIAIGIVLIAIAFCVTEISAHYHHKSKDKENKVKEDRYYQSEIKEEEE